MSPRQALVSQSLTSRRLRCSSGRLWLFAQVVVAVTFAAACGCSVWQSPSQLPAQSQVAAGPLIIHSDFELPSRHLVVDDLVGLQEKVESELQLSLGAQPIHVYLFDNRSKFSRYIQHKHPSFPNRRAFFVKESDQLSVYAFWGDKVGEDLRHEVTHGMLHSSLNDLPLWLDEGLAEYFELPADSRGRHEGHLKLLKKRYKSGSWRPDLARLEAIKSPGQLQQIDYAEAWLWVHWMLRASSEHRLETQRMLAIYSVEQETPPVPVSIFLAERGISTDSLEVYFRGLD